VGPAVNPFFELPVLPVWDRHGVGVVGRRLRALWQLASQCIAVEYPQPLQSQFGWFFFHSEYIHDSRRLGFSMTQYPHMLHARVTLARRDYEEEVMEKNR
jgi:hypothetical protein